MIGNNEKPFIRLIVDLIKDNLANIKYEETPLNLWFLLQTWFLRVYVHHGRMH